MFEHPRAMDRQDSARRKPRADHILCFVGVLEPVLLSIGGRLVFVSRGTFYGSGKCCVAGANGFLYQP